MRFIGICLAVVLHLASAASLPAGRPLFSRADSTATSFPPGQDDKTCPARIRNPWGGKSHGLGPTTAFTSVLADSTDITLTPDSSVQSARTRIRRAGDPAHDICSQIASISFTKTKGRKQTREIRLLPSTAYYISWKSSDGIAVMLLTKSTAEEAWRQRRLSGMFQPAWSTRFVLREPMFVSFAIDFTDIGEGETGELALFSMPLERVPA